MQAHFAYLISARGAKVLTEDDRLNGTLTISSGGQEDAAL